MAAAFDQDLAVTLVRASRIFGMAAMEVVGFGPLPLEGLDELTLQHESYSLRIAIRLPSNRDYP